MVSDTKHDHKSESVITALNTTTEPPKEPHAIQSCDDASSQTAERQQVPFFRGTTWQALVVAGTFFCAPGMYSALNSLGAGGLRSPLLVNITSSMGYGLTAVFSFFAGSVINVLGLRGTLSVGAVSFPLYGAALYCNVRYKIVWFLYLAQAIQGFCAAVLWYGLHRNCRFELG